RPRAAFTAGKRTWLLGTGANAAGANTASVVARWDGRKLVLVDTLPESVGAHDWLGLVAGEDNAIVIAAGDGTIARRDAAGAWTVEKLSVVKTEEAQRRANPPARAGAAE